MFIDDWIEYTIDLDLEYFLEACNLAFETQDIKYTGNNNLNKFAKVITDKSYLEDNTNKLLIIILQQHKQHQVQVLLFLYYYYPCRMSGSCGGQKVSLLALVWF